MSSEKAISNISKESATTFQEAMEKQKPDPSMNLVDVTHKLFDVPAQQTLPSSSICIYKGIIANLISWGRGNAPDKLCGIMAGDGKSVLDVVICTDFQACISSSRFAERLTSIEVQTMGIVVWTKEFKESVDEFVDKLKALKSPFDKVVLLVMCGGHDPLLWEVSIPSEGDITCTRCSGPKASSGRKKNEHYRVVDFDALSKSTTDDMKDTVSLVFKDSFKQMVSKKLKRLEVRETCHLQEFFVPADGLCFWHSILGTLEFDSWNIVPRKESGYSTNNRIVKTEEDRARSLMENTLVRAAENGVSSYKIDEVQMMGSVDMKHLQWIADALKFNIRCTVDDEAESGGFEGCVA